MPDYETVTILGCGVAGSWIAHELCTRGTTQFVLFGGTKDFDHVLEKGPYTDKSSATASEALAAHLRSINPDVDVQALGDYEPEVDDSKITGLVIGAMGLMRVCMAAFDAARANQLQWHSIGLASSPGAQTVTVLSPHDLSEAEHLGRPIQTRAEIAAEVKEFVESICA